jgi:hypothetical protein
VALRHDGNIQPAVSILHVLEQIGQFAQTDFTGHKIGCRYLSARDGVESLSDGPRRVMKTCPMDSKRCGGGSREKCQQKPNGPLANNEDVFTGGDARFTDRFQSGVYGFHKSRLFKRYFFRDPDHASLDDLGHYTNILREASAIWIKARRHADVFIHRAL